MGKRRNDGKKSRVEEVPSWNPEPVLRIIGSELTIGFDRLYRVSWSGGQIFGSVRNVEAKYDYEDDWYGSLVSKPYLRSVNYTLEIDGMDGSQVKLETARVGQITIQDLTQR